MLRMINVNRYSQKRQIEKRNEIFVSDIYISVSYQDLIR